jgi:type I restriction enzyme M protein
MASNLWRFVEGSDIRAVEGTVVPKWPCRGWEIANEKKPSVYRLNYGDIIVGLVRPERRNIGMLLDKGNDLIGIPDGIAVIRLKQEKTKEFSQEWLFAELRSERSRLQLWTESGGTSYGKLNHNHLSDLALIQPDIEEVKNISKRVRKWKNSATAMTKAWSGIGSDEDRIPIINSPITGLED